MAQSETRVQVIGGVLGPLELLEVKVLRELLDEIDLDNGSSTIQVNTLDKFQKYVDSVIEKESTVGVVI